MFAIDFGYFAFFEVMLGRTGRYRVWRHVVGQTMDGWTDGMGSFELKGGRIPRLYADPRSLSEAQRPKGCHDTRQGVFQRIKRPPFLRSQLPQEEGRYESPCKFRRTVQTACL